MWSGGLDRLSQTSPIPRSPDGDKNVFVLVLAHLEPELELFEVDDIGDDALARVLDELGPKRKYF